MDGRQPHGPLTSQTPSLRGAAQAVLGDLDAPRRRDFRTLVASLNQRFGSENQTEMFRAILKTKTRKPSETLPELAQSVRRLVKQAYPSAPYELLESLACDHFIDALIDSDTRWRIQQTRPRSLNQAVQVAVELEAFQEADRQRGIFRKNIRAIKSVSFADEKSVNEDMNMTGNSDGHHFQPNKDMSKLMFAVEQINKRLEKLESSSRLQYQPCRHNAEVECYHCGRMGHIKPNCPERNGQHHFSGRSGRDSSPGRRNVNLGN